LLESSVDLFGIWDSHDGQAGGWIFEMNGTPWSPRSCRSKFKRLLSVCTIMYNSVILTSGSETSYGQACGKLIEMTSRLAQGSHAVPDSLQNAVCLCRRELQDRRKSGTSTVRRGSNWRLEKYDRLPVRSRRTRRADPRLSNPSLHRGKQEIVHTPTCSEMDMRSSNSVRMASQTKMHTGVVDGSTHACYSAVL
jgi:hypothetical protein